METMEMQVDSAYDGLTFFSEVKIGAILFMKNCDGKYRRYKKHTRTEVYPIRDDGSPDGFGESKHQAPLLFIVPCFAMAVVEGPY